MRRGAARLAVATAVGLAAISAVSASALASAGPARQRPEASPLAQGADVQTATPIRHFIFLMQGGRTFDNYFGTYPGADGIPPGTCELRVLGNPGDGCVRPFPLRAKNTPLPDASSTIITGEYDHGKMNGFAAAFVRQGRDENLAMGYYDRRSLPFYWNASERYVLFDHFFSSALYGIRSNRSYWVSAAPAPGSRSIPPGGYGSQPTIFDRLQAAGISWKFYVQDYQPRDTYQTASSANPETQTARVPLVDYRRFTHVPALRDHIVGLTQYYKDLTSGSLPSVAYIASSPADNERSARSIAAGQRLVSNLVTQLMESRYWDTSALLVSFDGSGGWFDHVPPPRTGGAPLGFRVPALLISAFARKGQVNHTVLDYTSALRFIEQNWRLPPLTWRDAHANSLASAFDFAARPRPPALIPTGSQPTAVGLPAAHSRASPHAAIAGVLYGVAGGVSLLLVIFAAYGPGLSASWRARSAARGTAAREEGST